MSEAEGDVVAEVAHLMLRVVSPWFADRRSAAQTCAVSGAVRSMALFAVDSIAMGNEEYGAT